MGCDVGSAVTRAALATLWVLGAVSTAWGQTSAPSEPSSAASTEATRAETAHYRVLLLYSESRLTRSVVSADQAFRDAMESGSSRTVYFYTEFLDLNTFQGAAPRTELREILKAKYQDRRIDLIVAQGQLTVPLALRIRSELFPRTPVVLMSVEHSTLADLPPESGVTGTWRERGWRDTLDLARRLHPGTRHAVVIVGSSVAERLWLQSAREQLAEPMGGIEVSYLVDSKFEDMLMAVAVFPKGTVILMGPFLRDGTGRDFESAVAGRRIAAASRVPVYVFTDGMIGGGAVGGHVVDYAAHGTVAAGLALKVLAGERPPPTAAGTTVPIFDDRELRRWRVDRRLLPAGSVLRFYEPTLWERYRGYIIAAAGLILLQSALIAVLLVQRAQRRRAQRALAERLRFETLLANISQALASCPVAEIDHKIDAALRRIVEDLGTDRATLWQLDDPAGQSRAIHSCTRPGVQPMAAVVDYSEFPWIVERIRTGEVIRLPVSEDLPGTATDRQSLRKVQTRSTAVAPLVEGQTVLGGLSVGTVMEDRRWPDELVPRLRLLADIFASALSRQRAARAARESARDIRDLAGRLMTAEEDERRRIARELHDGVNQDLAALSIALSALQGGLPADTPEARREEYARLQGRAVELAGAIRHLSHELHPGILQYAGLAAALRSYCREFQREQVLAVACSAKDDLGTIPGDVALCLYRVAQEALKNTARHAKADHVWVSVERDGSDLTLIVRDDGRGFDVADARLGGGLGLMSLDERVRLVGGRITIDTERQRGTTIHARVPLA